MEGTEGEGIEEEGIEGEGVAGEEMGCSPLLPLSEALKWWQCGGVVWGGRWRHWRCRRRMKRW